MKKKKRKHGGQPKFQTAATTYRATWLPLAQLGDMNISLSSVEIRIRHVMETITYKISFGCSPEQQPDLKRYLEDRLGEFEKLGFTSNQDFEFERGNGIKLDWFPSVLGGKFTDTIGNVKTTVFLYKLAAALGCPPPKLLEVGRRAIVGDSHGTWMPEGTWLLRQADKQMGVRR